MWMMLFLNLCHLNGSPPPTDLSAAVVDVAHELRQLGDTLYWRYKLLEILAKNYKTVTKIK